MQKLAGAASHYNGKTCGFVQNLDFERAICLKKRKSALRHCLCEGRLWYKKVNRVAGTTSYGFTRAILCLTMDLAPLILALQNCPDDDLPALLNQWHDYRRRILHRYTFRLVFKMIQRLDQIKPSADPLELPLEASTLLTQNDCSYQSQHLQCERYLSNSQEREWIKQQFDDYFNNTPAARVINSAIYTCNFSDLFTSEQLENFRKFIHYELFVLHKQPLYFEKLTFCDQNGVSADVKYLLAFCSVLSHTNVLASLGLSHFQLPQEWN